MCQGFKLRPAVLVGACHYLQYIICNRLPFYPQLFVIIKQCFNFFTKTIFAVIKMVFNGIM